MNSKNIFVNFWILKIFLWIPNSATSSVNIFFSLNFLKTCPWWYATFIIPFFFVLIISLYRLTISSAFSRSCTSSASLFKSSLSKTLFIIMESSNFDLITFFDKRAFLLSVEPFHIYKQKNTLVPNPKTKNIYSG